MELPDGSRLVGADTGRVARAFSYQRKSQWCWAACIQMLFAHRGLDVSQERIVRQTYGQDPHGNLPDWPGAWSLITRNLNYASQDDDGDPFRVKARVVRGAPVPRTLVDELRAGRLVMVGYSTGASSAHAVLVTGARYRATPAGPSVQELILRDPWPQQAQPRGKGRRVVPGSALASQMIAHWIIRIEGGTARPEPLPDQLQAMDTRMSGFAREIRAIEAQQQQVEGALQQARTRWTALAQEKSQRLTTLQQIDQYRAELARDAAATDQTALQVQNQLRYVHPASPAAGQLRARLEQLGQQRQMINAAHARASADRQGVVNRLQTIDAVGRQVEAYGAQLQGYRRSLAAARSRLEQLQGARRAALRQFAGISGIRSD